MNTLLTIKQQQEKLADNWLYKSISHKWSCRGMGNSKILDARGNVIGMAGGCGYDRYGAALGNAIMTMFPKELYALGVRHCKGRRHTYKQAPNLYGLFYNSKTGQVWVDGACGSRCMEKILNAIGFSLSFNGETNPQCQTGQSFYTITPITKHERKYL